MSFLSHLEQLTLFTRAIGRGRIPICFSQGFHPHPKFSFATALSVGIESYAEYMDLEIAAGFGSQLLKERLNAALPKGMSIAEAAVIPLKAPSLSVIMDRVRYRVTLPVEVRLDLPPLVERFLMLETLPFRREKKGKVLELDLRTELSELAATGNSLEMVVGRGKPLEFTAAITGLTVEELADARIEKLAVIFNDNEWGQK
jgi:radical SAM-linked protein